MKSFKDFRAVAETYVQMNEASDVIETAKKSLAESLGSILNREMRGPRDFKWILPYQQVPDTKTSFVLRFGLSKIVTLTYTEHHTIDFSFKHDGSKITNITATLVVDNQKKQEKSKRVNYDLQNESDLQKAAKEIYNLL